MGALHDFGDTLAHSQGRTGFWDDICHVGGLVIGGDVGRNTFSKVDDLKFSGQASSETKVDRFRRLNILLDFVGRDTG